MSTELETGSVPDRVAPLTSPAPALKRETILPSSDRGRLAAIVATCSLAGLAGGMALSMLAETHRAVEAARAQAYARQWNSMHGPLTWLGVSTTDVAQNDCAGAQIKRVEPSSPAALAGFQSNDVIVSFGGDRVCGMEHLIDVVRASDIGARPEIHVRRGTLDLVLRPTLRAMPDSIREQVTR